MTSVLGIASICLIVISPGLRAQPDAADAGEFAVYTGAALGGPGSHPTVGGSSGISFGKYGVALVETSYIPLGNRTLRVYSGITSARSNLYDFDFSVHIRIPIKRHWAPYALLAPALLYNTYSIATERSPAVYISGQSDTKFGFEAGGGLRYYMQNGWGFQGEYRYTISSQNFSRILGGVFYQFDGTWPFRFRTGRGRTSTSIPKF